MVIGLNVISYNDTLAISLTAQNKQTNLAIATRWLVTFHNLFYYLMVNIKYFSATIFLFNIIVRDFMGPWQTLWSHSLRCKYRPIRIRNQLVTAVIAHSGMKVYGRL